MVGVKHEGLSYEDYSALEGVNWSRLREMRKSPLHFRYALQHPRDDEAKHFRIGSITHAYLLEPATVEARFAVWTGKVRNGKVWDAFKAEHAHQTILSAKEMDLGIGAAKAILAHTIAGRILEGGMREASFTWVDRETSMKARARIDHARLHLTEVKTGARLAQRLFENAATQIGYHGQVAYYQDGLRENGVDVHPEPKIIAVESAPPHDVVVFTLPAPVVEAGRTLYRGLLKKLAHCIETDTWPGRAPEELTFTLPMWALDDEDDDLSYADDPDWVSGDDAP